MILNGVLLPNTWASRKHKYLKHGGRKPVAGKKSRWGKLSQISRGSCQLQNIVNFQMKIVSNFM